jgi:SRSO17 transposase
VFLASASRRGHALVDRELSLPEGWLSDRVRCREAAIPDAVGFRTKPELARVMWERALEAKIPVAWVTGEEVCGGDGRLGRWLEERDLPQVLAVKRGPALWSMRLRQERAVKLAGQLPARAWRHRSAGDGAKGPRSYAWARGPIRPLREPGRGTGCWYAAASRTGSWRSLGATGQPG